MQFDDRIYGPITISDPLIREIVLSKAFQRLRSVNQYGGVNLIYPDRYQVSRFEHSIGVWWVLRQLGVDLETQVAGLLHDIGHTAFSHMVDLAMGGDSEDFHENNLDLIPGWSELQGILTSNDLKLKPLEDYPEVKTKMPRVGTDRLDYALRDFVGATHTRSDLGREVLNAIVLQDRIIHFTDIDVAREFAMTGLDAMYEVIYAPQVAVVYEAVTDMLRVGLKGGWLTPSILYQDDSSVFEILKQHQSEFEPTHLRMFTEPFTVQACAEPAQAHYRALKSKIRYFNPPVLRNGQSMLLSEVDETFSEKLNTALAAFERRREGEYFVVNFSS